MDWLILLFLFYFSVIKEQQREGVLTFTLYSPMCCQKVAFWHPAEKNAKHQHSFPLWRSPPTPERVCSPASDRFFFCRLVLVVHSKKKSFFMCCCWWQWEWIKPVQLWGVKSKQLAERHLNCKEPQNQVMIPCGFNTTLSHSHLFYCGYKILISAVLIMYSVYKTC